MHMMLSQWYGAFRTWARYANLALEMLMLNVRLCHKLRDAKPWEATEQSNDLIRLLVVD